MATTGKCGADTVYRWTHKNVHTLAKYNTKFRAVIVLAAAAGILTAGEAAVIVAYIDGLSALDGALKKLADYCGFD